MSPRGLRSTLTVLALAGTGIAGYLTYVHYAGIKPLCTAGGGCEKVQTSVYSEFAGIPVALLGLLGYLAILGLLLAPETETLKFAATNLILIGFAFSAYLTYREIYSIQAICDWCAASAAILTTMAPLAVWRFLRVPPSRSTGVPATDAPRIRSRVSLGHDQHRSRAAGQHGVRDAAQQGRGDHAAAAATADDQPRV
jgi:uncharacterized membrane protein